MKAPYYIEILARNGDVRRRERFAQLPLSIGRGYDNDVILDDGHAAIHHAVVECDADGVLVVRDAGAGDGIGHRGRQVARLALDGEAVFRLGHTSVRVRTADFDVAAQAPRRLRSRWNGWIPACAGLGLLLPLTLWSVWVADTEDAEPILYLTALAGMLALVLVWCGLWALASRLFAGQMRFGRHLFVVAIGLLGVEVLEFLAATVAYSLSFEPLTRYGSHLLIAAMLGIVYFHLLTINPAHRRGFAVACMAFAFLGSGFRLIFNYQNSGHVADELYMSELRAPAPRLAGTATVDDFFAAALPLQARVDAARSEEVNLDGEDGM